MKITIISENGQEVHADISDEDYAQLFNLKCSGYERRDHYYTITGTNEIITPTDTQRMADKKLYNIGNYYTDERVAQECVRADTLMRRLRQFAALRGELSPLCNAVNRSEGGYFLAYDKKTGLHPTYYKNMSICPGEICFRTEAGVQEAINEFKTELIWYFTEYYPIVR